MTRLDLAPIKSRLLRGYPGRALNLRLIDAKADVATLIRELEDARLALDGFAELIADGHLVPSDRGIVPESQPPGVAAAAGP
jgi:hypothetical protein